MIPLVAISITSIHDGVSETTDNVAASESLKYEVEQMEKGIPAKVARHQVCASASK